MRERAENFSLGSISLSNAWNSSRAENLCDELRLLSVESIETVTRTREAGKPDTLCEFCLNIDIEVSHLGLRLPPFNTKVSNNLCLISGGGEKYQFMVKEMQFNNPHIDENQVEMLYRVKARPVSHNMQTFYRILTDGTIKAQQPDGIEIIEAMKRAVMVGDEVEWYETCFCGPPLKHERLTVYDKFFKDMKIEAVKSPPRLEGESFWDRLRAGR